MSPSEHPAPTRAEGAILVSLLGGPLHGYAIMQEVTALSAGRTSIGPGTLYTAVARMVDRGWVEETEAPASQGERRRYYRLTATGRLVLAEEAAQWQRLASATRSLKEGMQ